MAMKARKTVRIPKGYKQLDGNFSINYWVRESVLAQRGVWALTRHGTDLDSRCRVVERYQVTHIPTGMALLDAPVSKKIARKALTAAAKLPGDWTFKHTAAITSDMKRAGKALRDQFALKP